MKLDARLVLPALACWVVAGVLTAVPDAAGWCAVALWTTAVGALGIMVAGRGGAGRRVRACGAAAGSVVVCAAAAAIAASAIALVAPARQPAELTAGSGTRVVDVVGTVTDQPLAEQSTASFGGGQRMRFRASLTRVTAGTDVITGSMPVLVFATVEGAADDGLQIGATVTLHGTLRSASPGDDSAFLLFASVPPRVSAGPSAWLSWANTLREGLSAAARTLPGDGGRLLPGLSIGDVSTVGTELDSSMKASALSHLTAVSGANCAVIIAMIMMLGRALGVSRGMRVATALVALCGFVVLVTPGPSVLRAAVMAAIVVFSAAAGRPGRGVPALSAAVVALLIVDPWMSRNYGFALSVLATAGLLVLAPPLTRALASRIPTALAGAVAIPLAAQLACQPVLIMLNPTVPLYGVAANLLAEPAAPAATILGLIACLVLPWFPSIGFACAQLAWVPAAWIAAVARVCSSLPGSALPWPGGAAGLTLMITVTAALVIVVVHGRRFRSGAGRVVRVGAIAVLVTFCGSYVGISAGGVLGRQLAMPSDWQIGACDIGQGDAVLVHNGTAHGLVDVGPDPKPLAACLDTLGIDRIDLLVLTHYDQDHVGGLDAVVGRVGTALVGAPTDAHDRSLVDALVRGGADVRIAAGGDHGTLGDLDWRVVWPSAGAHSMQTGNEGSVTVMFDGGGIRSIFLGDLDELAQNALLASGRLGVVDVVKVAHHGSADQSERLYRELTARVGLISVGTGNDYGHPTSRLLGILARAGTRAYRTDVQGMVLIGAGPHGTLSAWTEREATSAALRTPGARD